MFATIAGRYPLPPGDPAAALEAVLGDQIEAGLGMVGDGRVWELTTDAGVAAVVAAWQDARARAADLVRSGAQDENDADGADGALSGAGAASEAAPVVMACLLGPVSTPGPADAATERVRSALMGLAAAGVPAVQLHEPALGPGAVDDARRRRAVRAWRRCLDGVTGHVTLVLPGGGPSMIGAEAITAAPFASVLVDLLRGPDDWRTVAALPGELGVILGVADVRPGRPADTLEVLLWAARYAASMHGRGPARVGLAPSAGLEGLSREAARARLARLAEAARLATLPPDELARVVDPRSIDARSAALGRWEPRPRMPRPRRS